VDCCLGLCACRRQSDPGAPARLVDQGAERFPSIDIVLHALGGGYGFSDPLLEADKLTTLHHLNIGVGAELNRLLVPVMRTGTGGRIIHVCSIASGEVVASVGYNTVKAGLAAYVRGLGRALAQKNIVVTGILPGAFEGPDNAFARLAVNSPDSYRGFEANRLPWGKVGRAEELIPLLFLLAGEGASMMAGSCVPIDAGEGFAVVPDAFI
jgi:3-oxoacyl-[acyl-carrier protein] reductase